MNASASLHGIQALFLLLLVVVAGFAAIARKLQVPYPIVLVVAGLAISLVPGLPRVHLNHDVVFLVILPPLLFAAAWQMSWRDFRYHLMSISLMALGLVGFTVLGVAAFAERFIPGLGWTAGFLLGAVVSPTDAIAATSIARRLGLPRGITDVLEGESLVNDATGLLALEFGVMMLVQGQTPTLGGGLLRLLYLMVGGLVIGLVLGVVVAWFEKWVDDGPVEIVISLVVPYVAYLAGEWLHASGVLAVVACGLYMSRKSVEFFSAETRIQVNAVWNALTFIVNGIVFVLIGLQLPQVLAGIQGYSTRVLVMYGASFSVVLILMRLFWIYPITEISYQVRKRVLRQRAKRPGAKPVFVIGWTGMRGVVALAAAISLPETLADGRLFGERDLIIFFTFCVILVTLVLQGLTLPPLIRALGLVGRDEIKIEEKEARRTVLREVIAYMDAKRMEVGGTFAHAYEDLMHQYGHRLESMGGRRAGERRSDVVTGEQMVAALRDALDTERRTIIRLRDEGKISDDVLRTLEYELDLTVSRTNSRNAAI
jgi:Na+/H+ antiporter